jgi:hypothetical protein
MRNRAMGILFVLSGVFFLTGVLDPPILPTWGDSTAQVMATASAHRAAWFATTWLIALSIVAGLTGVELLARALGTDLARVGRSLYLAGSALGLASTAFDLSVTSTLLGAPRLPDWYLGVQHWADGLGTAYFALLAPAAMGCIAAAILRTRALPARSPGIEGVDDVGVLVHAQPGEKGGHVRGRRGRCAVDSAGLTEAEQAADGPEHLLVRRPELGLEFR